MEPLKNLPNFYVGQKVICINDTFTSLLIDQKYTIKNIICHGSGVELFEIEPSEGYVGFLITRFAPLQQQSFPLMTYSKVIERERELISQN